MQLANPSLWGRVADWAMALGLCVSCDLGDVYMASYIIYGQKLFKKMFWQQSGWLSEEVGISIDFL